MSDLLKIGCPKCGAILSVKNQVGIETKKVTCPVCKNISNFSEFKKVGAPEQTIYPHGVQSMGGGGPADGHTQYEEESTTIVKNKLNFVLGKLIVPKLNLSFQLKPGKNIIGRKAQASSAEFQIPCDTNRMSREHLIIEIQKDFSKGFVHCVSLFKEKVNPTYVDDVRLEYGDCVILKDGAVIKLPDVEAKFIIPDTEKTEF